MITDALIDFVTTFVSWLLDTLPTVDLPGILTGTGPGTVGGFLASLGPTASSFSVWLPLPALIGALALVLTAVGVSVAIKVTRIVASFLTAGGGSAA